MLLHPVTSRAWQVHWTMLRKRSYFVWQFTLTPSNIFLFFTEFGQQCPWIWGIRLIEAISWHFQAGQVMDALPSAHPVSDWLMCPSRPGNYFVLLWAKITEKTQIVFFHQLRYSCCDIQWLFADSVEELCNITCVNVENPYDEFCTNLKQHHLATEERKRFSDSLDLRRNFRDLK